MSIMIDNRNQLPNMLRKLELTGLGVEIGVQKGFYSEQIIRGSRLGRLFSIDAWKEWPEEVYKEVAGKVTSEDHRKRYVNTVNRLSKYGQRSVVMRMTSKEASSMFSNASLDFVYIDASHTFESCYQDILMWWPKVKKGGVFSGHDYMDDETKKRLGREHYGVNQAVDKFTKDNDIDFLLTKEDFATWYIIK